MNATNDKDQRRDAEALLPWYAAGTLSRGDARRVEQALADDPELARAYALVREELSETIHLNESLGTPSARALETLLAKIDAEPERKPAISLQLGARIAGVFADLSPRTLAWSASLAALLILVQAGFLADMALRPNGPAHYRTASAPSTAPGVGAFTLIRFAPQASFDDINKFLETNKLSIVAGPAPGGLYKVRVATTALPKAALDDVVNKLKADKVVGFIVSTP
jgi:hypothetical protein